MKNQQEQAQKLFIEGVQLLQTGNATEALARFQTLAPLCLTNVNLLLYTGTALYELRRYEQAVITFDKAIELAPHMGEAHNNLGNTLLALGRFSDAADSFTRAVNLLKLSPVPLAALATAQQACGQISKAEISCRSALTIAPDFAAAHWNLALNLLLQGHYEEGWLEYEWRWRKVDFTSPLRHSDIPPWDGSALNGKRILLHAEQGFGDAIQFVRYVQLVAQRGGKIVLECHPPLVPLFQALDSIETIIPFGAPHPPCSCQSALLSLPRIFGTTVKNISAETPYLKVNPQYRDKWAALTSKYPAALRVGLIWSGNSFPDPLRSCHVTDLAPLLTLNGITFFSLQIGALTTDMKPSLINLTESIHDFADTAAFVEQLDLVVSVDTAGAHLAAALGKPVCLLVPFAPDWRWLLMRSDSPWYPSMRLFRQKRPREWRTVINEVYHYLRILKKNTP